MRRVNRNCQSAWLCCQETPNNLVARSRRCAGCVQFKRVDKRLTLKFRGTRSELREHLGEAFHTAFRKATDCDESSVIWHKINDMPPGAWRAVLDFVMDCI